MPARRRRLAALAAATVAIVLLLGLGAWQVQRLQWKTALIAQVERRLAAPPVPAPGPARWSGLEPDEEYTRVRLAGRYRAGADTLVQALTVLGGGHWVLTPFDTDAGWSVLVNRGFVPQGAAAQAARGTSVAGLLRRTEPGGGFLRDNDPGAGRWYSRDVAAIAAARGIARPAPYFVDADAQGKGWPRGGMTVVRFANNHLVYALTWFGLAATIAFLLWRAVRR